MGFIKSDWLFMVCVVSVILIIFSCILFWVGFHNIDLAYNIVSLDSQYPELDIIDYGSNYVKRDHAQLYELATNQIISSLLINLIANIILFFTVLQYYRST